MRGSLLLNNYARVAMTEEGEIDENAGLGGGLMSFADGDSLIENTTFSGNRAGRGGGGLFHDADGELRIVHTTIWRNSAPVAGGIGVMESDFVPEIPPKTNAAVDPQELDRRRQRQGRQLRLVRPLRGRQPRDRREEHVLPRRHRGDRAEPDRARRSRPPRRPRPLGDRRQRRPDDDARAPVRQPGDRLEHGACSTVDQRGIERPQNGRCDAGAYEYVGDPPPFDDIPPDTEFNWTGGPIQDSIETMAFKFRGTDNITAPNELNFECRFMEIDLVEEPDVVAPWDPVPPELAWNGCASPWTVPLPEEGLFVFEVRAIDRADNIDPDADQPDHQWRRHDAARHDHRRGARPDARNRGSAAAATMPTTNSRSALFSFMAVSDFTPSQFAEYECRLDSRDPDQWLECFEPGDVLRPDDRRPHVRGPCVGRRGRWPGPDARALHVAHRAGQRPARRRHAAQLRRGEPHLDAVRGRVGRRGEPARELLER